MNDLLIQSLKAQAKLHYKSGAHGLGKLFHCAVDEIESLNVQLATAKADALCKFVSDTTETGQFGWSDCQWLDDWKCEWLEQQAKEQDE